MNRSRTPGERPAPWRYRYKAVVALAGWYCWAIVFFLVSHAVPSFAWVVVGAWSCIGLIYWMTRWRRARWFLLPTIVFFLFDSLKFLVAPVWMAIGYRSR